MEAAARCPACRARIAANVAVCPACGARLKRSKKAASTEGSREAPADPRLKQPKKKKKKKATGPNYALYGVIGGGVLLAGVIATFAVMAVQGARKPVADSTRPADQPGGPGQAPVVAEAPAWTAKADPPKTPFKPKDDLSIPIEGEGPLFASGYSPFVIDLVGVRAAIVPNPPKISVYDLRTGERTLTAKAIQPAQSPGREPGSDFYVAFGPEGKTLAARVSTTTKPPPGTRQRPVTTIEAHIYRLGQDAPVAKIPLPQPLSWMEFGKDDNQLIVLSVVRSMSAMAYDLTKPDQPAMGLEITRAGRHWMSGFRNPGAVAISPGRTYLAVGEMNTVELVQLTDGKLAGTFGLPGECTSVAFSPDGKELIAHSHIPPPPRARNVVPQYQWTTFSLETGKQLSQTHVPGGPNPGPVLAAGPKPGLAVHADRNRTVVTDTRLNAPAYSAPFPAARCFDGDRLVGYDAREKRVTVRRIDPEQLAAGEKVLHEIFGPRPSPEAVDRTALPKPGVPAAWAVSVDGAPDAPELAASHTISGGADYVMSWPGRSALTAVVPRRVETPRDRYALQWQRIDLAGGKAEEPIELWPSMLPPGEVPMVAGHGGVVADQTAAGSRLALRDAANQARIDVWDQSGKRLTGFLPYGEETPVEALVWAADNRLITVGGGKVTGWEVPARKAVFELTGYTGAFALSPQRKWIALQTAKYIDLFETATGKALGRLTHANPADKPWHAFAVTRDGTQLAAVELVRPGTDQVPGIWGYATWDLKTGMKQQADRLFTGHGSRLHHLMWIAPRLLLAGGQDVIDLDARAVTATLGLHAGRPLDSPDGRFWGTVGIRAEHARGALQAVETISATRLDSAIQALPRPAFADVVFREGVAVEVVSQTGDGKRDAVIRSMFKEVLGNEGYRTEGGGWRLVITGQRTAGTGATLETPTGGKIRIPGISGKVQLFDPVERVAWEAPLSGGWDMQNSKYKTHTTKEGTPGFGGSSTTHYNFGARDPEEAMAEEAWENLVQGLRTPRFPRVFARINDNLVPLPVAVPVTGK